jgi:SAM-dependent methyltransferase
MFLHIAPSAQTLLDVACGTGQHLFHLRKHYVVHGLDRSTDMLDVARSRLAGVPLYDASFMDFDLADKFDLVTCLTGSIGYAKTPQGLSKAIGNIARHLNLGGLLVLEPWITPEKFIEGRLVHDANTEGPLKVARMYLTARRDDLSIFDIEYIVGSDEGVSAFSEHHELGLFMDEQYRSSISEAGLTLMNEPAGVFGYGLYVARRGSV